MNWTKFCGIARVVMAAALIAAPATVVTAAPAYNEKGLLPLPFVVTDIQPAPANLAGATLETNGGVSPRHTSQADRAGR